MRRAVGAGDEWGMQDRAFSAEGWREKTPGCHVQGLRSMIFKLRPGLELRRAVGAGDEWGMQDRAFSAERWREKTPGCHAQRVRSMSFEFFASTARKCEGVVVRRAWLHVRHQRRRRSLGEAAASQPGAQRRRHVSSGPLRRRAVVDD